MLTSLQNPLVKQFRQLQQAKERRQQGLFLLEGTHLLEEAMATHCPLEVVCCTAAWQAHHAALWTQLQAQSRRSEWVTPEVLSAMTTTVNPDGVVALMAQSAVPWNQGTDQPSLCLALDTLQDPGNLGTMIRTATAAGVDRLLLSRGSVDIFNPKVLRASAGQWFRLPMQTCPDLKIQLHQYQAQGMQIVATSPTASALHWQIDLQKPSVILLGNEGAGLSSEFLDLADVQVTIPLHNQVESLNVAIVAALMVYEAQRQRHRN